MLLSFTAKEFTDFVGTKQIRGTKEKKQCLLVGVTPHHSFHLLQHDSREHKVIWK